MDGVDRPTRSRSDVVGRGILETLATGLHVSLSLRPIPEKGLGLEMAREPAQLVHLRRGEEAPGDFGLIGLRADAFEIHADVGAAGDADQGATGRVGEIEFESVAEFRAEVWLAEWIVNESYSAGLGLEIAP